MLKRCASGAQAGGGGAAARTRKSTEPWRGLSCTHTSSPSIFSASNVAPASTTVDTSTAGEREGWWAGAGVGGHSRQQCRYACGHRRWRGEMVLTRLLQHEHHTSVLCAAAACPNTKRRHAPTKTASLATEQLAGIRAEAASPARRSQAPGRRPPAAVTGSMAIPKRRGAA